MEEEALRRALMTLALERGASASFCPSEVARQLAVDWRPLMPGIRRMAAVLQAEGWLQVTQRGATVNPLTARGPIRLRLAQGPD